MGSISYAEYIICAGLDLILGYRAFKLSSIFMWDEIGNGNKELSPIIMGNKLQISGPHLDLTLILY